MVTAELVHGQADFFRDLLSGLQIMTFVRYCLHKGLSCGTTFTSRQMGPAAVSGNGQQPRLEIPARIPLLKALEHTNKRLLGDVFGVLAVTEHPEAEPEHAPAELVY